MRGVGRRQIEATPEIDGQWRERRQRVLDKVRRISILRWVFPEGIRRSLVAVLTGARPDYGNAILFDQRPVVDIGWFQYGLLRLG